VAIERFLVPAPHHRHPAPDLSRGPLYKVVIVIVIVVIAAKR